MARNLHHVPHYQPTLFPSMEQPAEFLPGLGWLQNGHIRHKVKPKYHFIWPKDGKRGSKWGRMKDIVQNKGPDIHVTLSADKGDYMHNRQRKPAWSKHLDISMVLPPITLKPAPWTKSSTLGGRSPSLNYDFHQRKYVPPHLVTWADAIWQGPNRNSAWPDAFKGTNGIWYEDVFSPIP